MSSSMDRLVSSTGNISRLSKDDFLNLKNEYGYEKAYKALGRELALDIGLHPLKEIVPIANFDNQLPESSESEFAVVFGFSYKRDHYIYSDHG